MNYTCGPGWVRLPFTQRNLRDVIDKGGGVEFWVGGIKMPLNGLPDANDHNLAIEEPNYYPHRLFVGNFDPVGPIVSVDAALV
jgi:hypothetical protein